MLPAELTKQLRLLEIRTNRIVQEIAQGAYRSVFKGRGIEFDEVREYTPDDDVRDIDWLVSARMNAPYVKKYIEERELSVLLAVDVSASGAFGAAEKSKRQTAAELAALLAFSAGRNGDKVGLLMFSDKIELFVPPRSGRIHTLRLIREMLAFEPSSRGTRLDLALKEAGNLMKKRGIICPQLPQGSLSWSTTVELPQRNNTGTSFLAGRIMTRATCGLAPANSKSSVWFQLSLLYSRFFRRTRSCSLI